MKITKKTHRKSFLSNKDLEQKYKSEKLRLKGLKIKKAIFTQKSQNPQNCNFCNYKTKKLKFCSFCGYFCCEICLAKKRKNPKFLKNFENEKKKNFKNDEKMFLFVCVKCEEDFIKLYLYEEFENKIKDNKKEEILEMNFMVYEKIKEHYENEKKKIFDLEKNYENEIFEIDKKIFENKKKEKKKLFQKKVNLKINENNLKLSELEKKIEEKKIFLEKIKNDIILLKKENKEFLNSEFEILKKIEKIRNTVAKKNNLKLEKIEIFEDLEKFKTMKNRVNLKSGLKKNNKKNSESCKCKIF